MSRKAMTAKQAIMQSGPKTPTNKVMRIKGRIDRYTTELAKLEKDGNANCTRAQELLEWIWSDERELKNYIQ